MSERDRGALIDEIFETFSGLLYPGDAFLQGSREGCEPAEVVGAFQGIEDWRKVGPTLLDSCSEALSFFSEAGFRFFLPAFLVADLKGQLWTADPLFHLTNGFYDPSVEIPVQGEMVTRRIGKTVFINPSRFGAMTFFDYACYRLSIFTREEATTIVAYLEFKRDTAEFDQEREAIEAALTLFWRDRAVQAPESVALRQHLDAELDFLNRLSGST